MEASAVTEGVVGNIQNMIGFVIGETNFEQVKALIDGIDESDALDEQMKGPDAAVADAVNAVGDFVVNIAGGENGSMAGEWFGFIEAALNSALASVEAIS